MLGGHELEQKYATVLGPAIAAALAISAAADETPLVVGRDVPRPRRVKGEDPKRPEVARRAGVTGVILLEVTLDSTGKPVDIKVLHGKPILDKAAVAAEFFSSREDAFHSYRELARSRSADVRARVFAVGRLTVNATKPEDAAKALRGLASDRQPEVAAAATAASQE